MAIADYETLKSRLGFLKTIIPVAVLAGLEDTIYGPASLPAGAATIVIPNGSDGVFAQVTFSGTTLLTCQLNWTTVPATTANSTAVPVTGTPSVAAGKMATSINNNTPTTGLQAFALGASCYIQCIGTTKTLVIGAAIVT